MIDRRNFILAGAVFAAGCGVAQSAAPQRTTRERDPFGPLQARLGRGGRLGVAALDVASGRWLGHDLDSRYAMCSTFKLALVACILARVDQGALSLDQEVSFGPADLLEYAPVVRANVALGRLPVERLCAAAVEVSDNSAANLLYPLIGGPAGLTAFIRGAGDRVTRCDRTEPALNSNLPGDPRDTTTPRAMVGLMRTLLLGDLLGPASRTRLIGWTIGATTAPGRLRAGFPDGWRVGHKSGTGSDASNDLGIAWPPERGPILIASFTSGPRETMAVRDAVLADVARLVAVAFVG
jgi:beta-lactamase class A